MIKFIKSFFGTSKVATETPAPPYKVEAQPAPVEEVQKPAEVNTVAVAVALDLETSDMGTAPAKKPRAPRAPKATTPKVVKPKVEKAPKAVKPKAPAKAKAVKAKKA